MYRIYRIMAVGVISGIVCMIAGCNTFAGMGEDITDSARAVQRAL